MSRTEKLIERLATRPRDFSWQELERLLSALGYESIGCGKTGSSRRRFTHVEYRSIILHKPHSHSHLAIYQINQIVKLLNEEGLL